MGGHKLIQMDYAGPEVDDEEIRKPVPAKAKESARSWIRSFSAARRLTREKACRHDENYDVENNSQGRRYALKKANTVGVQSEKRRFETSKHVSFHPEEMTAVPTERSSSRLASPIQTEAGPSRPPSPALSMTQIEEVYS